MHSNPDPICEEGERERGAQALEIPDSENKGSLPISSNPVRDFRDAFTQKFVNTDEELNQQPHAGSLFRAKVDVQGTVFSKFNR